MKDFSVVPAEEIFVFHDLVDRGYSDDRIIEEINTHAESYSELIDDGEIDYISAWHFTSHRLRESIENKGLKTRDDTNMPAQHLDAPSHEDKVYFSTEDGYVNAGRGMTEKIGGMPIGFQAYLNPDNLVRDEDTSFMHDYSESGLDQTSFYLISLATLGNMAHQGNIYPNQDSAPPGESFIVDWKTYNEDGIRLPNFVLDQFKSRIRAAEREKSSEDPSKIRNGLESVRDNFDTQITFDEARKLLNNQKGSLY